MANWTNWQDGEPNNLGGQVVTDDQRWQEDVTENDEKYLMSRVQDNPSEDSNENFRSGKLLIICIYIPC